jgi:hypothetical protein
MAHVALCLLRTRASVQNALASQAILRDNMHKRGISNELTKPSKCKIIQRYDGR